MSALGQKQTSLYALSGRRRPRPVGDLYLRPIRPHEEREVGALWRWQPVGALRLRRWIGLHIDRERSVGIVFQRLALGAERIAPDLVRIEKVILVVERQRPEAAHRRCLILGKRDRIFVRTVEALPGAIEVLIEILRLIRLVDEDVRFADRGAGEIICAERRAVDLRAPVVWKLKTEIPEFE